MLHKRQYADDEGKFLNDLAAGVVPYTEALKKRIFVEHNLDIMLLFYCLENNQCQAEESYLNTLKLDPL